MNSLINNRFLTLIIKVTHRCNFTCPYCYDWKNKKIKHDLEFSTIKEILKKTGKGVIKEWTWHGGEPMIMGIEYYEKQNQIIKNFDPDIRILMQSNASFVNKEWIAHFKKWNVGVGFSYDGVNNDKTRGHTDLILNNIKLMNDNGLHTGQILVITKDNINNLIQEYEHQKLYNLNQQWNIIFQQNGNDNTYNLSGKELQDNFSKFFWYYAHDTNSPMHSQVIDYYLGLLLNKGYYQCDHYHCVGKWLQIDTIGDIYPCGRDWTFDMKFGNIYEISDIKDVFKNDNFKTFLLGSFKVLNNCKQCKWFYQCHGGCYQNAYNYYGKNFDKPEPNYCYFMQNFLNYMYNVIHNDIDFYNLEKYNPYFLTMLYKYGFRPESILKKYIILEED